MLLIAPSEAATAISANCGGVAVSDTDAGMISVLELITPRVEDALNVESLTRGYGIDKFTLPAYESPKFPAVNPPAPKLSLRLTNGFVVPDTIIIKDSDGVAVSADEEWFDHLSSDYGIVRLKDWLQGDYTVEYVYGFDPITPSPLPSSYNPDRRVLNGIPSWMKGIVIDMLTQWYRTESLNPRVSKDVSYGQLSVALMNVLRSRIYSRYQRPRQNVLFADKVE
jgi:hypothetical protein